MQGTEREKMTSLPYLTEQELIEMTQYRLPRKQMEVLQRLGVHALLLRDRTVRVMRRDCFTAPGQQPAKRPQLRP